MQGNSIVVCGLIESAFAGVVLGQGISLRQAQVIDSYGKGVTDAEFARIPLQEITNDWSQVALEELDRDCVAHLDAEGFRYYIPALMLALVSRYEPGFDEMHWHYFEPVPQARRLVLSHGHVCAAQ